MNAPAAAAQQRGYLAADQAGLDVAKQQAAAQTGGGPEAAAPVSPAAPVKVLGWAGIDDNSGTPSDSTGAIGTTRYIETVNSKVGIYTRGGGLIATDTLSNWWAEAGNDNFDPQVIWDPSTNRFYYAGDSIASATDNRVAFGFSKTASPNNAVADWCHYQINYGSNFPDYPKLGDSTFFTIIGVNVFGSAGPFVGSDILALSKPAGGGAPITTCPAGNSFLFGVGANIKMAGGARQAFTPVPANEIDRFGVGYVVARDISVPSNVIGMFRVTKSLAGTPVIQTVANNIAVGTYSVPAPAPQKNTTTVIDTSDTRMTQAVAAVDPLNGNVLSIWTQHTTARTAGGGAEVRWYEINAATRAIIQQGKVTNATVFNFNAAISPDRVVKGTTTAYGGNMVLGYNTSSTTSFPAIKMVSKVGAAAQSTPVTVKASPGYDADFSCNDCRWGDYSAATPDPGAATNAATGVVFLTNQYTADSAAASPGAVVWRTWNWSATP